MLLKQILGIAIPYVLMATSCNRHTLESVSTARSIEKCGIVVRLSDRSAKVAALRESGMNNKADLIEEHDQQENHRIMDLFSSACGFTSVYYIYREDTEDFLHGEEKPILLNKNLERSDELKMTCNDFYFIEKGEVDEENEIQRANDWIVKDQNLRPVERPFPWRVKYPLDCLGKGKKTEIECLCFKIEQYIEKSY